MRRTRRRTRSQNYDNLREAEERYRADIRFQREWLEAVDSAYAALSEHLSGAIEEILEDCGDPGEQGLVFVSTSGSLARFSVAGLRTKTGDLMERWAFSVVPHFGFLSEQTTRSHSPQASLVFCAPDVGLMSARTRALFPPDCIFEKGVMGEAPQALAGRNLIWFSCHGTFDDSEPLHSRLLICGKEAPDAFTLDEFLREGRLGKGGHIVLAACYAGRTEPLNEHDQMIGFAHAFLLHGASSVWASTWDVLEVVGAVIWEGAELLRREGLHPALALARSQRQFRSWSADEWKNRVMRWAHEQNLSPSERLSLGITVRRLAPLQERLRPAVWAPFVTFGGGAL